MDAPQTLSPPSPPGERAPADRLQGEMSVLSLAFTVLAYNAPAFTFIGFIPVAIILGNGLGTPVTFLFCGFVVALLARALVAAATRMSSPGGFYSYITLGLGRVVGLGAGFAAVVAYFLASLAAVALGGIGLESLIPDVFHGPRVEWWIWSLLIILAVGVLGYFRIDLSARVLSVFLVAELVLVLAYDFAVIGRQGSAAFAMQPFELHNVFSGSVGIAVMFGMGLFGGFEATVIFRDECRDPAKTVPRATYLVVAVMAIFYAFSAWIFINAYGPEVVISAATADPAGSAMASIQQYAGRFAFDAASVLLVTSSFALHLSAHNIVARYVFNLSADGILPRALSQVHRRHVSPHRAAIFTSVVTVFALALVVLSKTDTLTTYARLLGAYSYAILILFALVAIALPVYLVRERRTDSTVPLSTIIGCLVPVLVLVFALFIATVNFDIVSGATGLVAAVLLAAVFGIIAGGMLLAVHHRSNRPDIYARIGRQDRLE